jgi:DNA-binding MarR family transcriptional regulator
MSDPPIERVGANAAPPRLPPALADETAYLLRLGFVRAAEVGAEAMRAGTTIRFYGVLTALTERGPHSQHELSKLLHVNRTVMVEVIDTMEDAGLVERRRNPADRRAYALEPTAAGRRALTEMGASADRAEALLTGALTGKERARLQSLLRAIVLADEEQQEIPDGLAARTGYLISISHLHVRDWFDRRLEDTGITAPHYGTLATIARSGPISQQKVAEQLGFTGTAVLQVVDRLEQDGLVERRRDPADRRAYALELTAKGRATLGRAQTAIGELRAQLAEVVGGQPQERELHKLLGKLLARPLDPSRSKAT